MRQINDVTLFHGNCLDVMPTLPSAGVDCIITDLPYAVLNKSNPSAQWDKEIDISKMWEHVWRLLKPNGACILFGQGLFSAKLILSEPNNYRYTLIWDKARITGFLNANRMPLRQHEDILVFYRKLPTYNPQMTKCKPHVRNYPRGNDSKSNNRCYGEFKSVQAYISDEKHPTSIIRMPDAKAKSEHYHPTEKPVSLLEWLIKTYSNKGDTVLDFTMGSGSTMVACALSGRKGIGIELEREYYEIATKRVTDATNK